MKRSLGFGFFLATIFLVTFGCSREAGPPPPLAAEQIPSEFEKTFKSAKPEVKELASKVTAALQSKDYPAAFVAIQSLCAAGGTTRSQQTLAARAMITINGLLQTAQSQGDEKAAAVIQDYRANK